MSILNTSNHDMYLPAKRVKQQPRQDRLEFGPAPPNGDIKGREEWMRRRQEIKRARQK